MLNANMTTRDAAHEWVRQMNAYPIRMIEKAFMEDFENGVMEEVTKPTVGDQVYISVRQYELTDENGTQYVNFDGNAEVIADKGEDSYSVFIDGEEIDIDISEIDYIIRDDMLPMWGTMWSFGDSIDEWWLENQDGIRLMSRCGFRIYYHDEFGYFFGIDGAGYDFYADHWIPLYYARGLQWHNIAE